MRIVIDARWLGRTGIGRYTEELLTELQNLDQTNDYLVLLLPEYFHTWKPTNSHFLAVETHYDVYTWQEQLLLPWQLRRLSPDLVHFTSFNAPLMYRRPFVVTIHDLILVKFKNYRGSGIKKVGYEVKYQAMRAILDHVLTRAKTIYVPTNFGKADLITYRPATRDRIVVTPEAVKQPLAAPASIEHFNLTPGFLLYVGNYYPYKNVSQLIRAYAMSTARASQRQLVLNGSATIFRQTAEQLVAELNLTGQVIFTGRTTDGELTSLYAQAQLFIFPSRYEGFGLPGLEAMIADTPVLAARASCLPEVYGDAAAYFDPEDDTSLTKLIDDLLVNTTNRETLIKRGQLKVNEYSWRRLAETTLNSYYS